MMRREVLKQMIVLATSAFGLVAALAWNSAIQELFKRVFGPSSGLISMFVYAILVTVIAVMVTTRLSRMAERFNDKDGSPDKPEL